MTKKYFYLLKIDISALNYLIDIYLTLTHLILSIIKKQENVRVYTVPEAQWSTRKNSIN